MPMTVSAIRFAPEEKEWIAAFADMNGKSFSAQVREWALEDEMDAYELKAAIEESRRDPGDVGISFTSFIEGCDL